MKTNQEEKERKWLLRTLPELPYDERIDIFQFYADSYRYRRERKENEPDVFYKLKKQRVAVGVNNELEIEQIGEDVFAQMYNQQRLSITKTRYVYKYSGFKFEVDDFHKNVKLVLVEVENVSLTDRIPFPEAIARKIIMEVTGMSQFDNFNLAKV